MARLFELVFLAFIFYLAFRRIVAPISRGFAERDREREQERRAEQASRSFRGTPVAPPRIDRTHAKDADFKDLA
jgi:hypothetical protein